jgi:hypothetical protein
MVRVMVMVTMMVIMMVMMVLIFTVSGDFPAVTVGGGLSALSRMIFSRFSLFSLLECRGRGRGRGVGPLWSPLGGSCACASPADGLGRSPCALPPTLAVLGLRTDRPGRRGSAAVTLVTLLTL